MAVVVKGGRVLLGDADFTQPADILVNEDIIADVARDLVPPDGSVVIDASDQIVIPGLINGHTHAHNNLTRGLGENWTLEDLCCYGPALYSNRTPDEQYLSAAIGAIEMVKYGCTTAFDMFRASPGLTEEGVDAVVQAYSDVGMRAVLAPSFNDRSLSAALGSDASALLDRETGTSERQESPMSLLALARYSIETWNGQCNGRITIGIGPSIPGQCSDALLAGVSHLRDEYGVLVQTHLAESKVEAITAFKRWGHSIVEHLDRIGLLGPTFLGAHAVWLTAEDISRLAATDSKVVHNPASNLRLGSGLAPIRELLDNGVLVALGTDGSMSSDNQNMFEALKLASLVGCTRFPYQTERWIGSRQAWLMATLHGAAALGMEREIGSIEPGKKADLVILSAQSSTLTPLHDVLNSITYSATGAEVVSVMVDGKMIVVNGRLTTINEDDILSRATAYAADLLERNQVEWVAARKLAGRVRPLCEGIAAEAWPVERLGGVGHGTIRQSRSTML